MTDVKLALRGLRGESFADIARRTGDVAGIEIADDATDQEVLDAVGASITAEADITAKVALAEAAATTATTKADEAATSAASVVAVETAIDQIFSEATAPYWDSETVVSQVTSPGTVSDGSTFNGFAQSMTVGGGPFNVVVVPRLRRPADTPSDAKWRKAIAIVRAAASDPHATTAPIVGIGIVTLDPDVDSYDDLEIYLRDSDGDGAYDECEPATIYTVGVFTLTDTNTYASMSRPTGTMTLKGTDSWYLAQISGGIDARVSNWRAYTGDPAMGFRLLYREGLVDRRVVSDAFKEEVAGVVADPAAPPAIVALPPTLFGVQGREMNLYFDNLTFGPASNFKWEVSQASHLGKQQAERWTWTPTGAVNAGLDLELFDIDGGVSLDSGSTTIQTAASLASPVTWKLMVIGDSTTAEGVTTGELVTMAAADANVTLELIGTKGSAPNLYEANSGWTGGLWYQPTGEFIALNPFSNAGAAFSFAYGMANGLAAFDDPTHVIFNLGINDSFNYATDALVMARVAADVIKFEAMIDSVHAHDAGIKVGVAAPIPPDFSQDAFGDDYGVQYWATWRHKRNILLYAKAIIDAFGGRTGENIWVVPINTAVDTTTGFPRGVQSLKHSRIPLSGTVATYAALVADLLPVDGALYYATDAAKFMVKVGATTKGGWREATPDDGVVERANNGVHPVIAYKQIADVYWAWLHVTG